MDASRQKSSNQFSLMHYLLLTNGRTDYGHNSTLEYTGFLAVGDWQSVATHNVIYAKLICYW